MTKLLLATLVLVAVAPGQRVFHTVDAALRRAFGDAEVERTTESLSKAELALVERLAGSSGTRRIVFGYVARRDGVTIGTAWFETHRVRTLGETVMVVVRPDGRVDRVVLCAFAEPLDYVPRETWYAQFVGRALDDDLRLRRGIDGVTGATLTARATTDCVRRILAVHRVVTERRSTERPPRPVEPPERRGGPPVAALERDER